MPALWNKSLQIPNDNDAIFNDIALAVFAFQYKNNLIYRDFVNLSNYSLDHIQHYTEIPFLPITFFKSHKVLSHLDEASTSVVFESSGTTGSNTSKHYVSNLNIYEESFLASFRLYYGDPNQYTFLCLLPSYLERQHSSLVYMCQRLIEGSEDPLSGFFLNDFDRLISVIKKHDQKRTLFIIGVTFGLLDFAEQYPNTDLSQAIIMETGGMKGRRTEWTRDEVHNYLCRAFNTNSIHSEYGMTELLSQAYSNRDGIFQSPPWMRILIRDVNDPKCIKEDGSGLVNVIDLANIYSCSFIATDDLGIKYKEGTFSILGRNDHSLLRGCSMLAN